MAYTPTTWTTGDTITASAMNKIEQGIADGSGGGGRSSVFYEITTTNFPNSNNNIGWFHYIKKSGNTYSLVNVLSSSLDFIYIQGNTTGYWMTTMVIPTLEDYFLAFVPNSGITITASSGGIASTPITISGYGTGYIVTDDFSVTLRGWA